MPDKRNHDVLFTSSFVAAQPFTVYLSEILTFFPEDFVPAAAPNLIAYVKRYSPMSLDENYRIAYIPYDWTIAHWRK